MLECWEDWKIGTPITIAPIAIGGIIGGNVEALAEIPLRREKIGRKGNCVKCNLVF
jgi:hypothetical protein